MSGFLAEKHVRSTRVLAPVVLGVMILAAGVETTLSVIALTAAGEAVATSKVSKDAATSAQHHLVDSRATESAMESRYNDALAALQVYTNKYGDAGLALIQQATSGANPPAALVNERNKFESANDAVGAAYGNLNAAKES